MKEIKDYLILKGYHPVGITYNGQESNDWTCYLGDSISVACIGRNIMIEKCGIFLRYISSLDQVQRLYNGLTDKIF